MTQQPRSTIGRILYLMRGIHIPPVYLLIPLSLSLVAAAFEGVSLGMLVPILQGFLNKSFAFIEETPVLSTIYQWLPEFIRADDRYLFATILGSFVLVYILRNVFRYLVVVSISFFSERCLHHLRKVLFGKYLSFGKQFFDSSAVGHHSTLLIDLTRQALIPLLAVDRYMSALFSLIVYMGLMLMISWKLTLTALPLFFLLHLVVRSMVIHIKAISKKIALRGIALGKTSVEILSTIPLVKSYRTERQEQQNFSNVSDEKARLDFTARALQALILPLQEIITILFAMSVFVGALYWLGREQIASAPALVVYFYIVVNASSKFGTLSGLRGTLAAATGPLDEVLMIFDNEGKHFVQEGTATCTGLEQNIVCQNLSFQYTADRPVLSDVSFSVPKGTMTAIVGPTGAGKSTIIHLLMRYYNCPPNSIMIDGTDVRDFTLDSYLQHVALVSQETLLIHDTLWNNITYGLKDVSTDAVETVLEQARLSAFVAELPDGLDTLIGDRGVKLSGGEKQRVSIARALLKGSEILILDEATSSLDSHTEKLIQEAIDEAVKDRTSIVIAHRLSTIQNADQIVVLEAGQVVESGTLDDLLARQGVFYRLWEEQKF